MNKSSVYEFSGGKERWADCWWFCGGAQMCKNDDP